MDLKTTLIVSYCIQIPLALYGAFGLPMRGELGTFSENSRKNLVIGFGLLPCAWISVIFQVMGLAFYFANVFAVRARVSRANAKFESSIGDSAVSSSGNPFGGGGQNLPESGRNPFDDGTGPSGPPGDNPFA